MFATRDPSFPTLVLTPSFLPHCRFFLISLQLAHSLSGLMVSLASLAVCSRGASKLSFIVFFTSTHFVFSHEDQCYFSPTCSQAILPWVPSTTRISETWLAAVGSVPWCSAKHKHSRWWRASQVSVLLCEPSLKVELIVSLVASRLTLGTAVEKLNQILGVTRLCVHVHSCSSEYCEWGYRPCKNLTVSFRKMHIHVKICT